MNKQIKTAWKPLAALGLALALAGCGNKGGIAGSAATGGGYGGGDTLATVGGTPITRTDLNKFLEAQSGATVFAGSHRHATVDSGGQRRGHHGDRRRSRRRVRAPEENRPNVGRGFDQKPAVGGRYQHAGASQFGNGEIAHQKT